MRDDIAATVGRLLHRDLPALGDPVHRRPRRQHPAARPRPRGRRSDGRGAASPTSRARTSPPGAIRTRADVAKTIYYRRRKGTPPMLEELARDVTGWGAHVVEFFSCSTGTSTSSTCGSSAIGCPDLRSRRASAIASAGRGTITTHTVDVRRDQRVRRLVQHPEHRLLPVAARCLSADASHAARHRRHQRGASLQPAGPGRPAVLVRQGSRPRIADGDRARRRGADPRRCFLRGS